MHDDDDDACLFYFCAVGHFFCKRGKKGQNLSFFREKEVKEPLVVCKVFRRNGSVSYDDVSVVGKTFNYEV